MAILAATVIATTPAMAEKPEWAGGKGGAHQMRQDEDRPRGWDKHRQKQADKAARAHRSRDDQDDDGDRRRSARRTAAPLVVVQPGSYFNDRHRTVIHTYYDDQWLAGRCPPGLAKKNNGCLPPGQAKKWHMGTPLPTTVRYYSVPQPVLVQLGPAPVGYRYVRVDDDILLLATATRVVVDAITGILGR